MITGIIMASGFSRRMGKNKLLMDFKGKKLIEYIIEAASQSDLDQVILVYRDEKIKELASGSRVKTIYNNRAHLGQSQSVVLGVENSLDSSYMFFAGDQPFIDKDLINELVELHKESPDHILRPFYKDRFYMPTIFPNSFRSELLKLEGDKGARDLIKANPQLTRKLQLENPDKLVDLDTQEDFDYWSTSQK